MEAPPVNSPVWDVAQVEPLPALDRDAEADACVVGLGGSGLACVHQLLDLGRRVIGIDAGRVAGGAAGRNGGFLLAGNASFYHETVAMHGRDAARTWYRATLDELDRAAGEFPDLVRRVGSLRIALSDDEIEDCAAQRDAMRADGFAVEDYAGPEGRGLLFPADATFQPLERCRRMATSARERGARLFEHAPAQEVGGDFVETPKARIRCRHVFVMVDGRLDDVCPALAGRVRTARLQMLATAPTDEVDLPRPVYARWGYEWFQQLPDRSVVLGGFRDQAGESEWTGDATPTPDVQDRLDRFLRGHIGVRAPVTHRWAASVGFTRDELPIAERLASGAWVAGGYSGTGNLIGAICARRLACLATGATTQDAALPLLLTNTPNGR